MSMQIIFSATPTFQELPSHVLLSLARHGRGRGGETWRGGGDYAKSSCSAEVNIRSESNEPSLSQINIECPIGCEGLIFQKLVFVEIENTQGSPIKTEDIKKVDFHVTPPLNSVVFVD